MTVTEKVAYLRGILDASELSEDAKETRIFKAIADVLDDLAMTVSDLEDGFSELSEQIDAVDEDLDALEQDYYDDEEYEDEDDDEFVEVKCPNCGDAAGGRGGLPQLRRDAGIRSAVCRRVRL